MLYHNGSSQDLGGVANLVNKGCVSGGIWGAVSIGLTGRGTCIFNSNRMGVTGKVLMGFVVMLQQLRYPTWVG